ncbi:MAG: signal recognition particle protein [Planctomycetota bacterium]
MFDRLSEGFNNAFRQLSGRGKISEDNIREAMGDVRKALLEADVHYDIVNEFTEQVIQESVGREVTKSLKPGQEVIKIVNDELIKLMTQGDPEDAGIPHVSPPPTVIMMCGLQGSGKTTTCGKLAAYLKKRGRCVLLVAADLQRPAAVEQLRTVAERVESEIESKQGEAKVECYSEIDKVGAYGERVGVAVEVCQQGVMHAMKNGFDTVILDTAGRLHINDELMEELGSVKRAVRPHQVLLVVDAMTGQDAVNSAGSFHEQLVIDGAILTKFDSDTRGGAALTVRKVTGASIKFIGVGEHLDQIEEFHAERISGRILGMGDVVSLVEKAQEQVSEEDAEKLAEKMAKGEFTMEDFLKQMKSLRKMGPMKQLLGMMPGVGQMLKDVQIEEKQLDRLEGMVHSMTKEERDDVKVLNMPRRRRVAAGSGVKVEEVSGLVKQFGMVKKMSQQVAGMGMRGKIEAMKELQSAGADPMAGLGGMPSLPGFGGKGSTKQKSPKSRYKKKRRR